MAKQINPKKAFSLMELMVVITIIAILIATGIPSYVKYMQRASLAEAMSILAEYKKALGVYWSTQGTLPGDNDTLVSTPADLPMDELVDENLPDSIESVEMTQDGNGILITVIIDANMFSSLPANNRQLVLGVQPLETELVFQCGNYTTDADGTSDLGFTDLSILPNGCNYNGVGQWLATDPDESP